RCLSDWSSDVCSSDLDQKLSQKDITHWVLHPGGRRIIETYHEAFGLSANDLRWTRGSLARIGNLSSASILFILSDLLSSGTPKRSEERRVGKGGRRLA